MEPRDLETFAELAKGFCGLCEDLWLGAACEDDAASWLGRLYGNAFALSAGGAGDGEAPPAPTPQDISRVRNALACFDDTLYFAIDPDPRADRRILGGSVSEDLLAVYREIKAGLFQYDHGKFEEALVHWGSRHRTHWGKDAVDGMRALHHLATSKKAEDRWKYSKTRMVMRKCEEEIALDPDDAFPYARMGNWWHWQRRYLRALENFNMAVRLDPGLAYARCARANLLATCPDDAIRDGKTAVLDARVALDIAVASTLPKSDWIHRPYLTVLAASYAEAGDFESAVKIQRDALAFANTRASRRSVEEMLKMYENREPVRAERGILSYGPSRKSA